MASSIKSEICSNCDLGEVIAFDLSTFVFNHFPVGRGIVDVDDIFKLMIVYTVYISYMTSNHLSKQHSNLFLVT